MIFKVPSKSSHWRILWNRAIAGTVWSLVMLRFQLAPNIAFPNSTWENRSPRFTPEGNFFLCSWRKKMIHAKTCRSFQVWLSWHHWQAAKVWGRAEFTWWHLTCLAKPEVEHQLLRLDPDVKEFGIRSTGKRESSSTSQQAPVSFLRHSNCYYF